MINYLITEYVTGFGEDYFIKYPHSHRRVYTVCDNCHKTRWVQYRSVEKLCYSCRQTPPNSILTTIKKLLGR